VLLQFAVETVKANVFVHIQIFLIIFNFTIVWVKTVGPYHTAGATQVFFASLSLKQLSFSSPSRLNSISTHVCAHGRAGLKTRSVQAH